MDWTGALFLWSRQHYFINLLCNSRNKHQGNTRESRVMAVHHQGDYQLQVPIFIQVIVLDVTSVSSGLVIG